jgi:hypothetical protein
VLLGYPADHLLDEDRLAHTRPAEQPDLASLQIRADKIEHLDPGLEDLLLGFDVFERRRLAVNRPARVAEHLVGCIKSSSPHVEDVSQGLIPDRNRDGTARVPDLRPPSEAVGWSHGHGPHLVPTQVLGGFSHDDLLFAHQSEVDLEGKQDLWHSIRWELDVHHRTRHLDDPSYRFRFSH